MLGAGWKLGIMLVYRKLLRSSCRRSKSRTADKEKGLHEHLQEKGRCLSFKQYYFNFCWSSYRDMAGNFSTGVTLDDSCYGYQRNGMTSSEGSAFRDFYSHLLQAAHYLRLAGRQVRDLLI